LFPVGRLDKDTEGLLLLTNDGQLAHQLLSPKKHVDKEYLAEVEGLVTAEDCQLFAQGFALKDGEMVKPSRLVIETINEMFEEAIVVTDVGQHQMFTTQYLELTDKKQLLTSGGLGTMGYGFPGAIGAQLGNPDTPVIAISGDGGMQMNIQEFATAVGQELPLILCVFNNNYLGMVRQWQKLFYGKRYSMTCLRARKSCEGKCGTPECECPPYTPDFVKLAESYGAKGIRVFQPEEIKEAFEEARKNTKTPTLIEFIMDPEDLVYPMIKPGGTLEEMLMDC